MKGWCYEVDGTVRCEGYPYEVVGGLMNRDGADLVSLDWNLCYIVGFVSLGRLVLLSWTCFMR